jgi:hypothetical protein
MTCLMPRKGKGFTLLENKEEFERKIEYTYRQPRIK